MSQIEFDHVSKYFMNEKRRFAAIDELSLSIEPGEFVFLIVWQEPALIRKKTIGENLEIVQRAMGVSHRIILENTMKALSIVGMRNMADAYPYMLSGGQIKLVELARAIICNPHILLLDEITANLDDDTGWDIMNILNEINRRGTTIVMATHAKNFVNIMCRRVVTLVSGRIAGDVEKGKYGELR